MEAVSLGQGLWPQTLVFRLARWLFYVLNWTAMRFLFRLRVVGSCRLPEDGPVIFTANHSSYLDAPALAAALPYDILTHSHWLARSDVVTSSWFVQLICRLAGVVPIEVDHNPEDTTNIAAASAVLMRKRHLIIFPEGTRSLTGQLQPFRPGIAVLQERFRVPIIPIYIEGTYEALPPQARWPRFFRRVTIYSGKIIPPPDAGKGEMGLEQRLYALEKQVLMAKYIK